MAEDLYKVIHDEDADWDPEVELIREIRLEDWRKCMPYARRIRVLNLGKSFGVTEDALLALCLFRRAECLLPRLNAFSLVCNSAGPKNMDEWLPRMIPPGLVHFSIYAGQTPHMCVPLAASQLTSLCPQIKELIFDFFVVNNGLHDPHQDHFTHSVERARIYRHCLDLTNDFVKHGFDHIEELHLGKLSLGPEVLCRLSTFQSLRVLKLWFNKSDHCLRNNDHGQFLHLTDLELAGISWSTASSSLDMLVVSPLRSLIMYVLDKIPEPQDAFVDKFLSRLARLTNLAHVSIAQDDDEEPIPLEEDEAVMVGLELAQLKNVDHFSFMCSPAALLGDAWYSAISPSWSLLTEIGLYSLEERPTTTLQGLPPLIGNCHSLLKLEVSVICSPFKVSPALGHKLRRSKIDYVDFIYSPFGSGMTTAILVELLLFMFPEADSITGESSPSPQLDDPWKKVNKEVELVIAAREVEELPAKSKIEDEG